MNNLSFYSIFLFVFLISNSCTHVNRAERDRYQNKSKVRHGIVPTESSKLINMKNNSQLDPDAISRGKTLYKENCYRCHGNHGDGKGPDAVRDELAVRNLREVVKTVPNFKFFMMISQWKDDMPGWKAKFSPNEVSDLEQYIRSLLLKN